MTPAARGLAMGLGNAQDLSFRAGNFLCRDRFSLVISGEKHDAKFIRLSYLLYLFSYGPPVDGMAIRRRPPRKDLARIRRNR